MLGRLFVVSHAASMSLVYSLLKHSHAPSHAPTQKLKPVHKHERELHHASRRRSTHAHMSMTVKETNRHKDAHEHDSPQPSPHPCQHKGFESGLNLHDLHDSCSVSDIGGKAGEAVQRGTGRHHSCCADSAHCSFQSNTSIEACRYTPCTCM